MLATALALSAADKAEADQLDKQYAAAAAAKKAQEVRGQYEIAKAQADADATHRAFRSVIAAGHASGTLPAAALPVSVPLPDTAEASTGTTPLQAMPPVPTPPDCLQALRAADTLPLALDIHQPQTVGLDPAAGPNPATTAPPAVTASIFDRFGNAVACYTHVQRRS